MNESTKKPYSEERRKRHREYMATWRKTVKGKACARRAWRKNSKPFPKDPVFRKKIRKAWRKSEGGKRHIQELRADTRTTAFSSGSRWTIAEIQRLMDMTIPDRQLAKELGRSLQAIQVKRAKLTAKDKREV